MDSEQLMPGELGSLEIERLGEAEVESPLIAEGRQFVGDDERVLFYSHSEMVRLCEESGIEAPMLERAGPRGRLFFKPRELTCGVVTCGGLCPGLNDVVRTITLSLSWEYHVKRIYGFRYGYAGLSSNAPKAPILLTPEVVDDIHMKGGDILGAGRGPQDPDDMVDRLEELGIRLLFVIGGDGTLHGAAALVEAIKRRGLSISVVGVPKTIDNDISGIEQSFGFSTAIEASRAAICGAHAEAKGAWNGVGLVKLMGRDSGFIAAHATLANSDVNFCFIPEEPLVVDGEDGFLRSLERRLDRKHHAVIVIAEGVGAVLEGDDASAVRDASGNILRSDIGILLKDRIVEHFRKANKSVSVKYIDPSYMIRSLPADSNDSAFCLMLGQSAVHAGMAGRTNMVVSYWNQHFVHIPISLAILRRKRIDPKGRLWQTVLETTRQSRGAIRS